MIKTRQQKLSEIVREAELKSRLEKIAQEVPDTITDGEDYAEQYFQELKAALFPDITD